MCLKSEVFVFCGLSGSLNVLLIIVWMSCISIKNETGIIVQHKCVFIGRSADNWPILDPALLFAFESRNKCEQ